MTRALRGHWVTRLCAGLALVLPAACADVATTPATARVADSSPPTRAVGPSEVPVRATEVSPLDRPKPARRSIGLRARPARYRQSRWLPVAPESPGTTSTPEPTAAEAPTPPASEAATLAEAVAQLQLTDVTAAAGLELYDAGHSVAWGDFNADGWPDLAVPAVFDDLVAIYLNDKDGTFTLFNTLPVPGNPLSVAVADYDGDGKPDLAACGGSAIVLHRATGGGYLWEAAKWQTASICSMVGFVDLDADGRLDLYTALSKSVASMGPEIVEWCEAPCTTVAPQPPDSKGTNRVLMQQPSGAFLDVTASSPLADPWRTLAFAAGHWLPDDGTALFVGNDTNPDRLFALPVDAGTTDLACAAQFTDCLATMGVVAADLDADGLLDMVVTDWGSQHVYRNLGGGQFEDASAALGVQAATEGDVGWGAVATDFDNDGDLDLAFGNRPQEGSLVAPQHPAFLLNHGGTYHRLAEAQGFPWLAATGDTHGVQSADYDRDGDVDLVFVEPMGRLWLYRNDSVTPGHWLRVKLRGQPPNTSAIGALVRVTAGGIVRVQEGPGVSGAAGQNEAVLHFGLGSATECDKVQITFASGKIRSVGPVSADQEIELVEP